MDKTTNDSGIVDFASVLAYLLSYRVNDFYARFISGLPIVEYHQPIWNGHAMQPFMMGVAFMKGFHVLLYNEQWVQEQLERGRDGLDEIRATLAHEAEHVILAHIARYIRLRRHMAGEKELERLHQVTNVAADMSANDLLVMENNQNKGASNFKSMAISKRQKDHNWIFGETMELPENLGYEINVQLLMDSNKCVPSCQNAKCNGNCRPGGPGHGPPIQHQKNCGAHDKWKELADDLSPEEADVLEQQIEQDSYEKLTQAVKEQQRTRGTVPGHVIEHLEELNKPPAIPWKRLLHQFITRCRKSKPQRAMERPRRRWLNLGTTLYPGTKRDRTFNIFFGIDTSGSMSTEDLTEGLVELQGIVNLDKDTEVTVVEFDTQIHKEYTLRGKQSVDPDLRGRGGTDFNIAFERAVELAKKGEVDCIIIYTDGYAPAPNELKIKPNDVPLLWCLTEGGVHPCEGYGFEIRRPRK